MHAFAQNFEGYSASELKIHVQDSCTAFTDYRLNVGQKKPDIVSMRVHMFAIT